MEMESANVIKLFKNISLKPFCMTLFKLYRMLRDELSAPLHLFISTFYILQLQEKYNDENFEWTNI